MPHKVIAKKILPLPLPLPPCVVEYIFRNPGYFPYPLVKVQKSTLKYQQPHVITTFPNIEPTSKSVPIDPQNNFPIPVSHADIMVDIQPQAITHIKLYSETVTTCLQEALTIEDTSKVCQQMEKVQIQQPQVITPALTNMSSESVPIYPQFIDNLQQHTLRKNHKSTVDSHNSRIFGI